ncbi:hypothetical protein A2U01_0010333 [Trifolium medium]|uniref:Uncharacterized protein n=1 Tax=Trifolium medium TaxID=97028 RepID=A0A392MPP4_9FABA|nr:hypothetical protein [Trifolium medium]
MGSHMLSVYTLAMETSWDFIDSLLPSAWEFDPISSTTTYVGCGIYHTSKRLWFCSRTRNALAGVSSKGCDKSCLGEDISACYL